MQNDLQTMWTEWWSGDVWIAPWDKALEGLTVEQAFWTPASGAHCIYQLVQHILFWREASFDHLAGRDGPSKERIEREHFQCPPEPDAKAWEDRKRELRVSHERIQTLLGEATPTKRLRYHLLHDSYHLGQILYLRRLQGLDVVMPA